MLAVAWAAVPAHARVILPTGRVVRVLPRIPGVTTVVQLRDRTGRTAAMTVDPAAQALMVYEEQDAAVQVLASTFEIEFLREEGRA